MLIVVFVANEAKDEATELETDRDQVAEDESHGIDESVVVLPVLDEYSDLAQKVEHRRNHQGQRQPHHDKVQTAFVRFVERWEVRPDSENGHHAHTEEENAFDGLPSREEYVDWTIELCHFSTMYNHN